MGLVSCVGKTDPIRYESGMSFFIAFLSFNLPSWESLETTRDKVYRFRFMEFVSCVFMAYSGFWISILISDIYATSETTWEVNLEERHRGEALKTHPASQHWGGCVTPRRFRYHHESNSETLALRDNESLSSRPWTSLRSVKMCRAKALPGLGFASQPRSLARSAKTLACSFIIKILDGDFVLCFHIYGVCLVFSYLWSLSRVFCIMEFVMVRHTP